MRHSPPSFARRLLLPITLAASLAACGGDNTPAGATAGSSAAAGDTAAVETPVVDAATAADPMAGQLAAFGGGMHALAEACGSYSASELDGMKAQQREQALQSGMSASDFEAGFARGHAEASAKIASASAADREKSCAQAEQLRQMGAMQAH